MPAEVAQAIDVSSFYAGGWALLPEYIVGAGAAALLLFDAFRKQSGGRAPAYFALAVLGLSLIATLALGGESRSLFSGMVVIDPFAQFFRVLFIAAGVLGVMVAVGSDEIGERNTGEYFSMFLGLVLGMMLMAESSDLIMLYISIELVSLMSYVLAGFRRHDRKSAEAALKYVIYGGAASGVMLFGLSLLYGLTGHTQLALINETVMTTAREVALSSLGGAPHATVPAALTAGVVLAFAGFGYKISAAPLHMWSPDVYEGAPTPFTAFLSTGPKAAGFAALIRFFVVGFSSEASNAQNLFLEISTLPWPLLIIVISMITMVIGNLAAIGQSNIKRFLAYSSIAHAGYSLMGLAAFSKLGFTSVLLYMAFYLVMNIGAFYCVIWVRDRLGSELINDYKGLGHRAPLVCVAFAICLFSLTGLPPFAGFIGKWYLFASVLDRASSIAPLAQCAPAVIENLAIGARLQCSLSGSGAFYALAVVGVINSAVSLYYYARVVRNMFLERPEDPTPINVDLPTRMVLMPVSAFLIVFGIYFSPLLERAERAIAFRRPTAAEVNVGQTPTVARSLQNRPAPAASSESTQAPSEETSTNAVTVNAR